MNGDARVAGALAQLTGGDPTAPARLLPLVYDELRGVAARYLARAHGPISLQPTALVHEAYLRLVDETEIAWQGRAHFRAVAAQAMHHVLIDHLRSRGAAKRGGGWQKVTLDEGVALLPERDVDLLALDEALTALAATDERQGRIVVCRFFGGMTSGEIAHVLGVSERTVEDDWRMARAWLHRRMGASGSARA